MSRRSAGPDRAVRGRGGGQSARTSRTTATRKAGSKPRAQSKPWWPVAAGLAAVALVAGIILVAWSSGRTPQRQTAAPALEHVHGLAVDQGKLYVASHVGLFRIDGEHSAVRVSKQEIDLMGFTAVGEGHFLASGHSGHGDGPANLGLIESRDGGVTWQSLSLSGAADFHGLQARHDLVYGYNSADGAFMVSADRRTWQRRATVAMGAFVVSPTDPQTVVAVGRDGLQRSTDGGRTWSNLDGTPSLAVLAWEQAGEVWGVGPDGTVWVSSDGGVSWQQRGRLPAEPHALTVHESTVYAAVSGDEVFASTDGGVNWTRRYAPR